MLDDLDRLPLAALRDEVLGGDPGCLCDPELFTGPAGREDEAPDEEAARIAVAREVCAACPARHPCLAYALLVRPAAGVWAGLTAEEIGELAASGALPVPERRAA